MTLRPATPWALALAAWVASTGIAGCGRLSLSSQHAMPAAADAATQTVARRYVGQTLALRQSHYYGELYDDNERLLASPYAFASLFHRVDLYGEPIHPGPAHGILPAGTSVEVEAVEFPGPLSFLRRRPNAPAAHVWVRLRIDAPEAPRVHGAGRARRPLVVVLERPTDTPEQLDVALRELLGPPEEVSAWLAELRPRVRVAVAHKQVVRGMAQAELTASQGEPWRWLSERHADGRPAKIAWYPNPEAVLVQDVVVDVRRPRPVAR